MTTETTNKVLTRGEVPAELTWRLEDIFATNEEWNKEFDEVSKLAEEAGQFKGTLNQGPQALLQALTFRDGISERLQRLYTYAHMRYDQDTTNSTYQAMDSRIKTLYVKVSTGLSYLVPEILSLSEDQLKSYVEQEEGLQIYRQHLEEINKERPHVLPAEQESLLAQLAEVTGSSTETFMMLNNADLEFPYIKDENGEDIQLTHGRYVNFLESSDRSVR